jgi:hypothetical protein
MLSFLLIYLLCAITGIAWQHGLTFTSFLKRVMMVLVIATGQILIALQALSLGHWLTGRNFFLANLLLTSASVVLAKFRPAAPKAISWSELFARAWAEISAERRDMVVLLLIVTSLGSFLASCLVGWLILPFGDCYHFEMPLFWIQNQSALPFPVHNPRIVSLSLLGEALALPGFLYARWPGMLVMFALFAGLMCLWIVFSLARHLRASFKASLSAAAITSGYTLFGISPTTMDGEIALLAAAFSGMSLLFLMDARAAAIAGNWNKTDIGCSLLCFLMSCGAKNSSMLLAPLYLVALGFALQPLWRATSRSGWKTVQQSGRQLGLTLLLCGVMGLLLSGIAWNYIGNQVWFGNSRGPKLITDTLARDFHVRAIWTRFCRGATLLLYDTIWCPSSQKGNYIRLCQATTRAFGAKDVLSEDNDYFSFNEKSISPRKGLGLVGIGLFLPGLVYAAYGLFAQSSSRGKESRVNTFNTALLFGASVGSFLLCHLVLRWQPIGLLRLMFPFIISGAPLSALLLERQWLRVTALVLLLVSSGMFLIYSLGIASDRLSLGEHKIFKSITRLRNDHGTTVEFQWKNSPPRQLVMREDYTSREIYLELMKGLRQPCSIGIVGHKNAECEFLFGERLQNRVIPLVDSRSFDQILEPPEDLNYLVAVDKFAEVQKIAEKHGFTSFFTVTNASGPMLVAFERATVGQTK